MTTKAKILAEAKRGLYLIARGQAVNPVVVANSTLTAMAEIKRKAKARGEGA